MADDQQRPDFQLRIEDGSEKDKYVVLKEAQDGQYLTAVEDDAGDLYQLDDDTGKLYNKKDNTDKEYGASLVGHTGSSFRLLSFYSGSSEEGFSIKDDKLAYDDDTNTWALCDINDVDTKVIANVKGIMTPPETCQNIKIKWSPMIPLV